ncbi:SAM-dependent DNA methyltransferase [Sphaerisporangium album]|uniref:site-specific DNA-methyltransferase (adenine-specific) n=1 Tax=Sphaerisporangium album TaxID=509200 RepID=A0A367FNW2_9ACTN|nr:class I SAM-dependent DNA methyltransferase [Sphaerisporangium album]RCG32096.1 SAM-dependent DNA methyltransferase [Sphaerisporangium album]
MPPRGNSEQTSRARLSSVIKSARDTMRKDAGLNGDLDRLPQLSWLLFLRAFDAMEANREVWDDDFRPAIIEKYRWRAWAGNPFLTGDDLLTFVNDELLPHLRGLKADRPGDPRNVLSALFKDIRNQMMSGYLLRDLLDGLQKIDFTSSDDIHTMAFLYESILKEVRDAAGDSGEFYTPRPVIRFMVEQSFLRLGESILDPACGTGGFLVEALENLQGGTGSTHERQQLWRNLRGIEKKPLPYLLCMMNLILHGVESPSVIRDNALTRMLDEQGQKVHVILTNPPFGGEEENSVAARFPTAVRTKETAWLFLHSVLTKLRPGGRCAIVLPNGVLFGDGAGTAIKEKLLRECDLHTIVRLPQGIFAPYTQIPANLLFFDKTGPTKEVWFYQIDPPEGRKNYSKTKPLRYEEFADCAAWWGGTDRASRTTTNHAWSVPISDIIRAGYNLDLSNPTVSNDLAHRPPAELLADLLTTERGILNLLESLQRDLKVGK